MDRSPTRICPPPRATWLGSGFLICALLVGLISWRRRVRAPAEARGPSTRQGATLAWAGRRSGGSGGQQPCPIPRGKIDPRLLADATMNQPYRGGGDDGSAAIPTAAIDEALATATDPNQIAVLTARLDAVKDQMMDACAPSPSCAEPVADPARHARAGHI